MSSRVRQLVRLRGTNYTDVPLRAPGAACLGQQSWRTGCPESSRILSWRADRDLRTRAGASHRNREHHPRSPRSHCLWRRCSTREPRALPAPPRCSLAIEARRHLAAPGIRGHAAHRLPVRAADEGSTSGWLAATAAELASAADRPDYEHVPAEGRLTAAAPRRLATNLCLAANPPAS